MEKSRKDYYAEYYQKNKDKHNDNMKQFKNKNPLLEKKYRENYINKNRDQVVESWRISKLKQNEVKRNFVDEYKKQCRCSKCNEERYYVLDFHHLDPSQKDFNIGEATKYGLNKIKIELEKCVVLCRNCHSEFHFLEKEKGITIEEYLK